jgi:hypothetical protein
MEHFFELPVTYKGKDLLFNGRLVAFAFSYKFYITIDERELVFERDDHGEFRVMKPENMLGEQIPIDSGLITEIIAVLEAIQS